ncbi:MliC family protein [Marinivivus vitaminiproducens]|uniref:MliC family protein n=1 Tax=Marinivivus vitaminiproducens TaxID=3035935 RepID=UPI0027A96D02|nr:MliC family protein [Geminicoccaceae bacterium SCSIO 64248]
MRRSAAIGLLLALPACASGGSSPEAEVFRAAYACDDGTGFDVAFQDGTAYVTFPDGARATLEGQPVGSGMWYLNDRYELRGKGDEAMWTEAGEASVPCRATQAGPGA